MARISEDNSNSRQVARGAEHVDGSKSRIDRKSGVSRGPRSRAGWSFLDQAISSATNFAAVLLVLRASSAEQFGGFAVAYGTYALFLGLARALISQPLVIRFTNKGRDESRSQPVAEAAGASALIGIGALVAMVAASRLIGPGSLSKSLLIIALAMPLLLMQDSWRFVFFAQGQPHRAAANDLAWALAFALLLVVWRPGEPSTALVAWGVAGSAAGLIGLLQTRTLPSIGRGILFVRKQFDLGARFAAEFVINRGLSQVLIIVAAYIVGLATIGSILGARTLLGPINVLFAGAIAFGIPEGVRILADDERSLSASIYRASAGLALMALLAGLLLHILPPGLGSQLTGESWKGLAPFIAAMTFLTAAEGWRTAQMIGLRSLGDAKASLRAQVISVPIMTVGAIGGSILWGGFGAAWGLALSMVGSALIWTVAFDRANRKHRFLLVRTTDR